ncbi:MAG: flagellar biosynthetic protein FliR [Geminicoccaceae bacterium]
MRNGIVLALSLPVIPMVLADIETTGLPGALVLVALLLKEAFIGIVIGLVVSFPIFAMQIAGGILDMQRGAMMATESSDPGNEATLTGGFLSMLLITYMLVSGAFLAILDGVMQSLSLWPPLAALPTLSTGSLGEVFTLLDRLMQAAVLIAAPLLIAMVVTEVALAITTRSAPTLNVFVLALAVKSLVLFIAMPLYMGVLGDQAGNLVEVIADIVPQMRLFLGTEGPTAP